MLIRKWIIWCGIILLIAAKIGFAQDNKVLSLTLEDSPVSPEISIFEENNHKFVNLPFLRRYFHVATSWSPSNNELYFKFGTFNFKFYAGKTTYYVNGSPRTLAAAPFERNGDFWLPLTFFTRLGMVITVDTSTKVALKWDKNYLLGIENITYQNRPAFLLMGSRNFTIKHYSLQNPERLVCEIPDFKLHFTVNPKISSNHPFVKQIRVRQAENGSVLIVFDLKMPCNFNLIRNPEQPGTSVLVFNYTIDAVSLIQQEDQTKVAIKTSLPPNYQVFEQTDSNQLVLKFYGAILKEGVETVAANGDLFRSIRVNQDDINTVSITLEPAGDDRYIVTPSRKDPHLIEVKKTGTIKAVQWSKTESDSLLTVSSNNELVERIKLIPDTKRLQIDFEYTQFDPQLTMEIPATGPIKAITFLKDIPNSARIVIDFNYLVSYRVNFSADRRTMSLRIKNSNLVGKTIVIDPGHGGPDSGACGKQGTREKDLNLETAFKLKNLLEQAGATVLLTRNSDFFIGLYERAYFANYHKADLFLSIHANSHPNPNIRGIEIFHYNGQWKSQRLAEKILSRMTDLTGFNPIGVKSARFVVVRETQMPAVLVELGFLSNYQEETILKTNEFKFQAALGIFLGIVDYY